MINNTYIETASRIKQIELDFSIMWIISLCFSGLLIDEQERNLFKIVKSCFFET
jgi:hypothetical protein